MQFLVTTHEPLCFRGLVEREVVPVKPLRARPEGPGPPPSRPIEQSPSRYRVDHPHVGVLRSRHHRRPRGGEGVPEVLRADPEGGLTRGADPQIPRELSAQGILRYTVRDQLVYEAIDGFLADSPETDPDKRRGSAARPSRRSSNWRNAALCAANRAPSAMIRVDRKRRRRSVVPRGEGDPRQPAREDRGGGDPGFASHAYLKRLRPSGSRTSNYLLRCLQEGRRQKGAQASSSTTSAPTASRGTPAPSRWTSSTGDPRAASQRAPDGRGARSAATPGWRRAGRTCCPSCIDCNRAREPARRRSTGLDETLGKANQFPVYGPRMQRPRPEQRDVACRGRRAAHRPHESTTRRST